MALRAGTFSVAFRLWQRLESCQPATEWATHPARSLSARAAKGPVRFQPLQPQTSKKPALEPVPSPAWSDGRPEEETGAASYLTEGTPDTRARQGHSPGLGLDRESQGHGPRKGGGRKSLAPGRQVSLTEASVGEWPADSVPRRLGDAPTNLLHSPTQPFSRMTAASTATEDELDRENGAHGIPKSSRERGGHKDVRDTDTEPAGRRSRRILGGGHVDGNEEDSEIRGGRKPVDGRAARTAGKRMSPLTAGNVKEDSSSWRSRILDAIDDGTFLASLNSGTDPLTSTRDFPVNTNAYCQDTFKGTHKDTDGHTGSHWSLKHELDEGLSGDSLRESSEGDAGPNLADPEFHKARVYAFRLLSTGMRTEANIRQKLKLRGVPAKVADAVVALLKNTGLQSDAEFADAFASARFRLRMWGPKRISMELRRRGVAQELIDSALKDTFQEIDLGLADAELPERLSVSHPRDSCGTPGSWDPRDSRGTPGSLDLATELPRTRHSDVRDPMVCPPDSRDALGSTEPPQGLSASAWAVVLKESRRRWAQTSSREAPKRKQQMVGWLLRRGYPWRTVSLVLQDVVAFERSQEGQD